MDTAKERVHVRDRGVEQPPSRELTRDGFPHPSFEFVRAGHNDTGIHVGSRSGEIVKHSSIARCSHTVDIKITLGDNFNLDRPEIWNVNVKPT